jgi:hypothetical protein
LFVAYPVFILIGAQIAGRHKTGANMNIATDLYIVIHREKYLAFFFSTQACGENPPALLSPLDNDVFTPLDQKVPFSTSYSYGSC